MHLREVNSIKSDFERSYPKTSELATEFKKIWKERLASTERDVSEAKWLVYLSPVCGDTLTAAVYGHWDRPSPMSYNFHFTFDDQNSLEFVSISWMHHSTPPPPLKGWPE